MGECLKGFLFIGLHLKTPELVPKLVDHVVAFELPSRLEHVFRVVAVALLASLPANVSVLLKVSASD